MSFWVSASSEVHCVRTESVLGINSAGWCYNRAYGCKWGLGVTGGCWCCPGFSLAHNSGALTCSFPLFRLRQLASRWHIKQTVCGEMVSWISITLHLVEYRGTLSEHWLTTAPMQALDCYVSRQNSIKWGAAGVIFGKSELISVLCVASFL